MAEQMTKEQLIFQEKKNTGTTWTHNNIFDKNGYLTIRDFWNPKELYHSVPEEKGQYNYWDNNPEHFNYVDVEQQVEGSTSRYWHPQYRIIHSSIRIKLEEIIGRKLYNTYYYDRYYFPGQELTKHIDRDACEISVSVHVGTNLEGKDADWPIWIKTPDIYTDKKKTNVLVSGESHPVILKPGDCIIYKGCERPHWRNAMPGSNNRRNRAIISKKTSETELYYHQIFFHYVLQDGQRAHCAWDKTR